MLRSSGARWWLRVDASSPPEQASRNDARIVDDENLVAFQEARKLCKQSVIENSRGTIQGQKPRCVATVQGTLRNLPVGETVVEFVQTHRKPQSTSREAKASKTNELFDKRTFCPAVG